MENVALHQGQTETVNGRLDDGAIKAPGGCKLFLYFATDFLNGHRGPFLVLTIGSLFSIGCHKNYSI